MPNPFSQIDPSPLPQGHASGLGRAAGLGAQNGSPTDGSLGGEGEFEALLAEKSAPLLGSEPGEESAENALADGAADLALFHQDGVPLGEDITLATALAGLAPGQAVPPAAAPDGKAGGRIEPPTLPPAPGGGPLTNADIQNDATPDKKSLTNQTTRPQGAGTNQQTAIPAATTGAALEPGAAEEGRAKTAASLTSQEKATPVPHPNEPKAQKLAAGKALAQSGATRPQATTGAAASAVAATGQPAPTGAKQTQATPQAPTITAPQDAAEAKNKNNETDPAAAKKLDQARRAAKAPAPGTLPAQAVARGLIDGPAGGAAAPEAGTAPGQAVSSVASDPVLRVAPPLTPGGAPNLPVRSIALHMVQQSGAGVRQFNISLSPASLGRIRVEMEISKDGFVTASLTVDRPETLDALQRDARALERALQNAGLKSDGGSLNFSLRDQSGERQTADTGQSHD
ncbi:MAG: flagellar hook-length control protein FliK, partial [Alphaproteobacteria bacterium]